MAESEMRLNSAMQGIVAESGRSLGGQGAKGGGANDEKGVAELFKINQVYYGLPPTLSIVSKRTLLANMAQRMSYQRPYSDVITFIFNTGEFYVSMLTSYLFLSIGYSNTATYQYAKAIIAQGNAMSLFEEVVLMSASGTEICREQNKGLNSAFKYYYRNNQEYIDTIGQVQGAPKGSYSKLHDGVGPIFAESLGGDDSYTATAFPQLGGVGGLVQPRTGERAKDWFGYGATNLNQTYQEPSGTQYLSFCIPMKQVLGCFDTYLAALFPAGALAGARLEMRLKNPNESMQFIGPCVEKALDPTPNTPVGYAGLNSLVQDQQSALVINQIYIVMDAFQLQDNVLKRLNKIAASQDGLNVLFDTYDHSVIVTQSTGVVEAPIQQARSRISTSWVVVRDQANVTNPYINSLAAEATITRVSAGVTPDYNPSVDAPISSADGKTVLNSTGYGGGEQMITLFFPKNTSEAGNNTAPWLYNPIPTDFTTNTVGGTQIALLSTRLPILPATTEYQTRTPTVSSYQAQIGSLFMPQAPLTTVPEYYQNACYIFGNSIPSECKNGAVTYEDFLGGLGFGLYSAGVPVNPTKNSSFGHWIANYGLAVFGVTAEKSQKTQLSGLPLTNARLLRHKFTFATPPLSGTNRVLNVFTEFVRVLKLFLGGKVVIRE